VLACGVFLWSENHVIFSWLRGTMWWHRLSLLLCCAHCMLFVPFDVWCSFCGSLCDRMYGRVWQHAVSQCSPVYFVHLVVFSVLWFTDLADLLIDLSAFVYFSWPFCL
jgi:hypothetical protein